VTLKTDTRKGHIWNGCTQGSFWAPVAPSPWEKGEVAPSTWKKGGGSKLWTIWWLERVASRQQSKKKPRSYGLRYRIRGTCDRWHIIIILLAKQTQHVHRARWVWWRIWMVCVSGWCTLSVQVSSSYFYVSQISLLLVYVTNMTSDIHLNNANWTVWRVSLRVQPTRRQLVIVDLLIDDCFHYLYK